MGENWVNRVNLFDYMVEGKFIPNNQYFIYKFDYEIKFSIYNNCLWGGFSVVEFKMLKRYINCKFFCLAFIFSQLFLLNNEIVYKNLFFFWFYSGNEINPLFIVFFFDT